MTAKSLGKVIVPTPGTIVQLSAVQIKCAFVRIEPLLTNTGAAVYVGDSTLNVATMVGAMKQLQKPVATNAFLDALEVDSDDGGNLIDLRNLYVDAAAANDGVLVYYSQK